tara:strand:+ start:132 stop:497 length:366 start_codon:yes stop_codon:yes gene_type:complete
MVYETGEISKTVYENDKIIKETLENIVEKEKKLIKDFKNLKDFRSNAPIEFIDDIDSLLDERKLYLTFKLQTKEKQVASLIKLLDYINMLESKNKKLESDRLLSKIENLEKEIMYLREIFN